MCLKIMKSSTTCIIILYEFIILLGIMFNNNNSPNNHECIISHGILDNVHLLRILILNNKDSRCHARVLCAI